MKTNRDDVWKWYLKWRDELPCACCGFKAGVAMEFHHRDPREKKFQISRAVYIDMPLNEIRAELEKCDPLCANCHKIVHSQFNFNQMTPEMSALAKSKAQIECAQRYREGR
ncbi:MAG: hypothetical protein EBR82_31095 [Caulobacteraceae bacterium]|nr:hypothetical protein [Caulobacteraceae bacterium]